MTTSETFVKIASGKSEKFYNGLLITKTWCPSNFAGTIKYHVNMPNGRYFSSASWDNLKKQIKKNI